MPLMGTFGRLLEMSVQLAPEFVVANTWLSESTHLSPLNVTQALVGSVGCGTTRVTQRGGSGAAVTLLHANTPPLSTPRHTRPSSVPIQTTWWSAGETPIDVI